MRILFITGIFPPDIGGPATYVPMMAATLADRGHTVKVLTLSSRPAQTDTAYSFPVVRIARSLRRPLRVLLTIVAILRHGRRADVLFVNGLALESVLANCLLRKPLVQKVVGDLAWERCRTAGVVADSIEEFQNRRYTPRIELLKRLRSLWVRASTTVIAPSAYLKEIIAGWGVPEERIRVVYNAVRLPEGKEPPPAELADVHGHTRIVVSIGRLMPWKGFDDVIRVCAGLPDVRLFIIGDGPHRNALEQQIAALGAGTIVQLVGSLPQERVASFLHRAHLFVLNSRYEGLPHIVLEAMAAGVPVVATDAGGTRELVRDRVNGLLVPPGDTERLMHAIREALDDQALRKRLVGNAAATLAAFSPAVQTEQTEALLMEAAGRAPADAARRIPVLFLSTERFMTQPDATFLKKWSGLQRIFEATVLSVHEGKSFLRTSAAGVRWVLLPAGMHRFTGYVLYMLWACWQCMLGALLGKYDAIIAQSPFQAVGPALALLPWRLLRIQRRPKLIIEIHNDWTEGVMLYHPGAFSRIEHACRMALGRFTLGQADAYRVISAYCRALLPQTNKPVFVFPTFTDLERFIEPPEAVVMEMRQAYGSGYFLSAGMLIELKGVQHLIRAFADLITVHPEARLVIAGKGRDGEKFKKISHDLGVEHSIQFVGHREQTALAALMKNACAFVLPSLTEGLGRVAIEAQMLGRPVIASRVGGIPEIIEDGTTGILVPPADPDALCRAMREVLEHPAKAGRMGVAGRERIRIKFDYANYFNAYADMVKNVCSP